MYTDISTTSFPKTLMIRNHEGGMIWQVYHVDNIDDVERLTSNAHLNGFYGSTLEDHQPEHEETWPDWRETKSW
jgi:hypothetical protein